MREIKFRVWDEALKHYAPINCVYGFVVDHDNKTIYLGNKENYDELTVEQYTGLKDCNGKEIYEGDIVFEGYEKQVIIFDKEYASFKAVGKTITSGMLHQRFEIIGNIHENKEK